MKHIFLNKYYLIIFVIISIFLSGFGILHYSGQGDQTMRTSGVGCICHGDMVPTPSVKVWITGPDSVEVGKIDIYTISIVGGPAVFGGFNIAVGRGTVLPVDNSTQIWIYSIVSELVHFIPKPFQNDTVSWQFEYRAPGTEGFDTIFIAGNSVDGSGDPFGDQWNFGDNFIIKIFKITDISENNAPLKFYLYQNYPNPFNPSTIISFILDKSVYVDLSVFNQIGQKVTTLKKGQMNAGIYKVNFNGCDMPTGVYIYQLHAAEFMVSKKMLLIR